MMPSRRDVLRSGAAVALGAAAAPFVAACGGDDQRRTSSGGPGGAGGTLSGDIQFAWWGGDERAKYTQQLIKTFEKKHADTSVAAQFSDWDSYWQKITTSAAGGNIPDVLQMDISAITQFATKNQLLALDDYSSGALDLGDTDKALLDSGRIDGKLYAIGTGGNMSSLVYNDTAVQAASMPIPDDGFTWDTLASYVVELQKKLPTNRWAIDAGYNNIWFDIYMRQLNDEEYTADGKIAYTKDQVLDWFTYWYDLQRAGVLVPPGKAPNASSGSPADSPFALGFTVLQAEWTNLFPTDAGFTKDKLGLTRTPTGGTQAGDSVNATMQWCVGSTTENVDLALAFIAFLLHDPDAIKTIGLDRGVPGNPAARDLVKPTLQAPEQLEVDFLAESGPEGRPIAVLAPAYVPEVTDALKQAADSISLGRSSPAQAADEFWDAAQQAAGS